MPICKKMLAKPNRTTALLDKWEIKGLMGERGMD
jgi:hypothetical protein